MSARVVPRVNEEAILSGIMIAAAGLSPLIFPAAQAGVAPMSRLALWGLIPSLVIILMGSLFVTVRGHRRLLNRLVAGSVAGLFATIGLEAVRLTGFYLGWMPGDLARLLGVLLTDRLMLGPSQLSNYLGYAYHFWNGAAFGIVFAVIVGRKPMIWGIGYALLIAAAFLLSPAIRATGVGFMGLEMPTLPLTVLLAHLVFGAVLGLLCERWVREDGWLLSTDRMEPQMKCHLCHGPTVEVICSDPVEDPGRCCAAALRCLYCGAIINPVI